MFYVSSTHKKYFGLIIMIIFMLYHVLTSFFFINKDGYKKKFSSLLVITKYLRM